MLKFNKEDIGKKVLLLLEIGKIDSGWRKGNEYSIGYDAIKDYKFLVIINDKGNHLPRINITSEKAETIDLLSVAKGLGVSLMTIKGSLTEICEDYIKVCKD